MATANITSKGIKKALNEFSAEKAIGEYVSNGFDAGASIVNIDVKYSEFGNATEIIIRDNGCGIDYDYLSTKFQPILESEKAYKRKEENIGLLGKDGYGRLTFFKFAQFAEWHTTYHQNKRNYTYSIKINIETLNKYDPSQPIESFNENQTTGTSVIFTGILHNISKPFIEKNLVEYLKSEFAWFLELHESKGYQIMINGKPIVHNDLITKKEDFSIEFPDDKHIFSCKYIQWNRKLVDEYSRFYFVNEEEKLKYRLTTKLNNKGDRFYHSVIVKSSFFENFVYDENDEETNGTGKLFNIREDSKIFSRLTSNLNNYLKQKRKPFLKSYSSILLKEFEKQKVMPEFGNNKWDKVRKEGFETLVKGLYEVEPALFVQLNIEQKKTFLHLLNLILDSDERDSLFKILENVIELNNEERQELEKILKTTKLSNIIKTLRLVHDRLIVLDKLKELVFDHGLKANEVHHLQKIIEEHYWVFGEEYNFVCSAEVKFEEALRRYLYILRGEDIKTKIEHPDKLKEVDVFVTGQDYRDGIHNIIIELKNPTSVKTLTNKQLTQIETYKSTILAIDEFNDTNCSWSFYLVGQDYDSNIAEKIDSAKNHGLKNLVYQSKNYKIFVFKWSEIINDVEIRLHWLNKKLQVEREKLTNKSTSAQEIIEELKTNTAKADTTNPLLKDM
ncbi:MAG: ATP-binding protein [Flavobacteriaceae bacterium]|jgi:hypothetical protein|nr:ATP-binding protein [Flavobacteriaceae bacterium]